MRAKLCKLGLCLLFLLVSSTAAGQAPANDAFAGRIAISGASGQTQGSNIRATREPGEPYSGYDSPGNSVWWSWTAPFSGQVTFGTVGSDFDTIILIYTGGTLRELELIADNDESGPRHTSRAQFEAAAGVAYQIAVIGYSGDDNPYDWSGSIVLNWTNAVPVNDHFADRLKITGEQGQTTGNNINATGNPDEDPEGFTDGSVWWSWTAPKSAITTIDTIGSDFDTILGIFVQAPEGGLQEIAIDDDGGPVLTSRAEFQAEAGTNYLIVIRGYAAIGRIQLNWFNGVPANDDFGKRRTLTGISGSNLAYNVNASKEPGEPAHAGYNGGASIWWTWTATRTGLATFETESQYIDPVLAIYTGNALDALTEIASDDDSGSLPYNSRVTFQALQGTRYQIAADSINPYATNYITLKWSNAAPSNDHFANRKTISGLSGSTTGTNVNATREEGEPAHAGEESDPSVWWVWKAPANGKFFFDTLGSDFDTVLGVYSGSPVSALSEVGSNDDFGDGYQSRVGFVAKKDVNYKIAVSGYAGEVGHITLNWRRAVSPPNDDFADRIYLIGGSGETTGTNVDAMREVGEPETYDNGSTVWWVWKATETGRVTFDSANSEYETTLKPFTGSPVSALNPVLDEYGNEVGPGSRITFNAQKDVHYKIVADTWENEGAIALRWSNAVPANDQFANAILLGTRSGQIEGTTLNAGIESAEPIYNEDASVWWRWKAPEDGKFYISANYEAAYGNLCVYSGRTLSELSVVELDAGESPWCSISVQKDMEYFIATSNYSYESGPFVLHWTCEVPPNDPFEQAIALSGASGSVSGMNINAGFEAGEPEHDDYYAPAASVWWTWRAPGRGQAEFATMGSDFDTELAIYTGANVSGLTKIVSNDDGYDENGDWLLTSRVTFDTQPGMEYKIAVDGNVGDMGTIVLTWNYWGTHEESAVKPADWSLYE
jgi:hypothetical protein